MAKKGVSKETNVAQICIESSSQTAVYLARHHLFVCSSVICFPMNKGKLSFDSNEVSLKE
ncbi:MAG: hypothetical protein ACJAXY_001427 [Nonlabens sp.]